MVHCAAFWLNRTLAARGSDESKKKKKRSRKLCSPCSLLTDGNCTCIVAGVFCSVYCESCDEYPLVATAGATNYFLGPRKKEHGSEHARSIKCTKTMIASGNNNVTWGG